MNFRAALVLALPRVALHGAEAPPVVVVPVAPPAAVVSLVPTVITERTLTIALGDAGPIQEVPMLSRAPIAVAMGTRLKFTINGPRAVESVRWFKDSTPLAPTGATLELAAVSPDDAGTYSGFVKLANGDQAWTDYATITVPARASPRLVNTSARVRLGPEQPTFITGFVVEPAPAGTLLLLRAVGPGLATFGVTGTLAAPQLRVFGRNGQEMTPVPPVVFAAPTPAQAAQQTGAFPLPADAKDVARLYQLSPGAYTAQVSSADGGSGVVLFEVYEVPRGAP